MEKVLTIHDWYDGPLLGLAYYDNTVCIYECIFDKSNDDWTNEYLLTPINDSEKAEIMTEWDEWCKTVANGNLKDFYDAYLDSIDKCLKNNKSKVKYRKKAMFHGQIGDGWIPIDYNVIWTD